MSLIVRPYAPADLEALRALLAAPGIEQQFDKFQGPGGLERKLGDPHTDSGSLRLALVDGQPAGFGLSFVLGEGPEAWAMMRVAVLPEFRRRGIGRALVGSVTTGVTAGRTLSELATSVWVPEEGAEGLARALGYREDRTFWMMTRPRGAASPVPEWPAGVEVRTCDGSDADLLAWNEAYNLSFADHYHFVSSSEAHVREMARDPSFRPEGLFLAFREGRPAGFCRNVLLPDRGEVATLGTVPAARGIGLGRALLRAGVAWLEAQTPLPVTLLVDGENENALTLYRREGFEITRTRRVWVRRP